MHDPNAPIASWEWLALLRGLAFTFLCLGIWRLEPWRPNVRQFWRKERTNYRLALVCLLLATFGYGLGIVSSVAAHPPLQPSLAIGAVTWIIMSILLIRLFREP